MKTLKTITLDLTRADCGGSTAWAVTVIPVETASYQHENGSVESHLDIQSVELHRDPTPSHGVALRLTDVGGAGSIDLWLCVEAAEKLGVSLIKATTLPIDDSPLTIDDEWPGPGAMKSRA
jgi:hypothetical protein